jgi:hypothetical protein
MIEDVLLEIFEPQHDAAMAAGTTGAARDMLARKPRPLLEKPCGFLLRCPKLSPDAHCRLSPFSSRASLPRGFMQG